VTQNLVTLVHLLTNKTLKKERFNAKYNTAMGQIPRISSSTYSQDFTTSDGFGF